MHTSIVQARRAEKQSEGKSTADTLLISGEPLLSLETDHGGAGRDAACSACFSKYLQFPLNNWQQLQTRYPESFWRIKQSFIEKGK